MLCPACGTENIDGSDRCDNCLTPFRDLDVPRADSAEGLARSVMEDRLSELNYDDVICIGPEMPALEVARLMKERKTGCALVMESNNLLGIFTEHDVLRQMTSGSAPTAAMSGCEPSSTGPASESVNVVDELRVEEVTVIPVEQLPLSELPFSEIPVEELRARELVLNKPGEDGEVPSSQFAMAKDWQSKPVKDLMTPNPEFLHEHETVAFALNKMSIGRYRHLPVQKSDGSYAVASIKNVLSYIAKEDW